MASPRHFRRSRSVCAGSRRDFSRRSNSAKKSFAKKSAFFAAISGVQSADADVRFSRTRRREIVEVFGATVDMRQLLRLVPRSVRCEVPRGTRRTCRTLHLPFATEKTRPGGLLTFTFEKVI